MKKHNGRFVSETDDEYRKLSDMRMHFRKARVIRKILFDDQEVLKED